MTEISAIVSREKQDVNFIDYFSDTSLNNLENKKKKTSRACLHCQKAHLTCDELRPCQRCVKRNLSSTCTDAIRKRAKYLQETSDKNLFSNNSIYKNQPENRPSSSTTDISSTQPFLYSNQFFDFSLSDLGFGSETVGLEYDFIGNMLQTPLDLSSTLTLDTNHTTTESTQLVNHVTNMNLFGMSENITFQQPLNSQSSPFIIKNMPYNMKHTVTSNSKESKMKRAASTPVEIYTSIQNSFNYAEGFHYLIRYVQEKMNKEDLMRISRALALFRPSFLALIMNLTEEDLLFMEKCIQRTLLEYEKLISFSGTPTAVWRRTGEICLVGKEFSLLTNWRTEMLVDKKIYIYELMDSQSAVEYWEKFSKHAFDNTNRSCTFPCIIKTPQQKPVPCTFCFTIKRDIFDLPSVIVGNFLPILS